MKVVIIDDNECDRLLLQRTFREADQIHSFSTYAAFEAACEDSGEVAVRLNSVDFVIIDLDPYGMDVIRYLLDQNILPSTQCILCTGRTMHDPLVIEALVLGVPILLQYRSKDDDTAWPVGRSDDGNWLIGQGGL